MNGKLGSQPKSLLKYNLNIKRAPRTTNNVNETLTLQCHFEYYHYFK